MENAHDEQSSNAGKRQGREGVRDMRRKFRRTIASFVMGDNPRSIIVGVGTVFPLDPPTKLVRADERGDAAKWNALESLGTTRLKPQITK